MLRYLPTGALELRVYPFTGEQSRKTGFSLLHKRPFTLQIDGQQLPLGEATEATSTAANVGEATAAAAEVGEVPAIARTTSGVFISAELKERLPTVERLGYWHFIFDCSAGNDELFTSYKTAIQALLEEYPAYAQGAKVSFVGHSVNTYSLADAELESLWLEQEFRGGFYLERAFQSLLLSHYKSSESGFPVPVVISNSLEKTILPATLLELSFAMPEHKQYYQLDKEGHLRSYSLAYPQQETGMNMPPPHQSFALSWTEASGAQHYLKDDGKDVIVPLLVQEVNSSTDAASDWHNGLELFTCWQADILYPQHDWKEQVKASFSAHILSPHTAFMVVEEAWQKDMLLQKQEQFLNGHPGFDGTTELAEMPEPEFWLLATLFGVWLWWRKRKIEKNRRTLLS